MESFRSVIESDPRTTEKEEETSNSKMSSNDSADEMKTLQEDLDKLTVSLQRINEQV